MNDVIRATVKAHNKQSGKTEWRVLVVDNQSMRMVSACTKMHELSAEGITSTLFRSMLFDVFLHAQLSLQLLRPLTRGENLCPLWKLSI
jgi:hypothetical protein